MIETHRHKISKMPEDNYTIAACDSCGSLCAASKCPGRTRLNAADAAEKLAKEAGWTERLTKDGSRRRRKMSWTVQLLCPECAAKSDEAVSA